MATIFRRKLYKRGSSFETTVPMPLLFAIDTARKYNVVFAFEPEANKWFIKFEEIAAKKPAKNIDEKLEEKGGG